MFRGLRILNINIMAYTMQQINAFNDAELKEYVYQLEMAVILYGKKLPFPEGYKRLLP